MDESHLGKLIRASREARAWSQDELKRKLGLARPISISKWERGEAPVPLHHWLDLMRVLEIDPDVWVEVAARDRHRQLSIYRQFGRSLLASGEAGAYGWPLILRTISPALAPHVTTLRQRYQDLSAQEFVKAAMEYFVEHARAGLDRNNRPILLFHDSVDPEKKLAATPRRTSKTSTKKA